MKAVKQLRELKKEDLLKKLREARLELMKERGSVASGRAVKNTSRIRNLRRLIARIETLLREKS